MRARGKRASGGTPGRGPCGPCVRPHDWRAPRPGRRAGWASRGGRREPPRRAPARGPQGSAISMVVCLSPAYPSNASRRGDVGARTSRPSSRASSRRPSLLRVDGIARERTTSRRRVDGVWRRRRRRSSRLGQTEDRRRVTWYAEAARVISRCGTAGGGHTPPREAAFNLEAVPRFRVCVLRADVLKYTHKDSERRAAR